MALTITRMVATKTGPDAKPVHELCRISIPPELNKTRASRWADMVKYNIECELKHPNGDRVFKGREKYNSRDFARVLGSLSNDEAANDPQGEGSWEAA